MCLVELRAANNCIREVASLAANSALEVLLLGGNNLQALVSAQLGSLGHLARLDLSDNRLSSLRGLEGALALRELSIRNNQVASLEPLARLGRLVRLCAAHNALADADGTLGLLERLGSLEQLDLRGNPLTELQFYRESFSSVCCGLVF